MPKAEKGSLKDIGKRIKAKGLQKLKFYCQMCEKQCRDANGFKCHLTSESHLRQMKIFSENASGIMDRFSKEFEKVYMDSLRMRHGTAKMNANQVYQEVIRDKSHIHMSATMWATLTDFVKYLGRTGKCVVEENERGWFVTYIDRDLSKMAREEALQKRQMAEADAEKAWQERLEQQRIEAAKMLDRAGGTMHVEASKIEGEHTTVQLDLKVPIPEAKKRKSDVPRPSVFGDDDEEDEEPPPKEELPLPPVNKKRLRVEEPKKKPVSWLYPDILVRIIHKKSPYKGRKAVVDKLVDNFTAEVTILDSGPDANDGGDVLRIDQDDLETVIPKQAGKKVRILKGPHRGERATVLELNPKKERGTLELKDGTVLGKVRYDDFSKLM